MTTDTASRQVATVSSLPAVSRSVDIFSDPAAFEHAQRVAKVFASSKLVPTHLQGNVADCLIALQIARRLNEEPLTVMQQIYIVSGRPGWFTSYVIARANRSGVFRSPITWKSEGQGETLAVTATAVIASTGEAVGVTCDMRMAKAEGWTKNAKYTSMPEHMLRWRSAAMLVRLYAPEVMLGMPVIEEIETAPQEMRDVTPKRSVNEALDAFAEDAANSKPNGAHTAPSGGEASQDPARSGDASPAATSPQTTGQAAANTEAAPETQAPQADAPSGAAEGAWPEGKTPANEAEYTAYAHAWIDDVRAEKITPADAAKRWKDEKSLRNKCGVTEDQRDPIKSTLDTVIATRKAA